jgi:hypothetical protein
LSDDECNQAVKKYAHELNTGQTQGLRLFSEKKYLEAASYLQNALKKAKLVTILSQEAALLNYKYQLYWDNREIWRLCIEI